MPAIFRRTATAALFAFGLATAGFADGHMKPDFTVIEAFEGTVISLEIADAPKSIGNLTLTVAGPREYSAVVYTDEPGFKIDLREFGKPFDGRYRYEITAATAARVEINTPIDNNGRSETARQDVAVPISAGGNFVIGDGKIMMVDKTEEEKE